MNTHTKSSQFEPRPVDLRSTFIRRVNLSYANLEKANLSGADCTNAVFRGTNFRDAILRGTILRGADLRDAINLTRAQISEAITDSSTLLPSFQENVSDLDQLK